MPINTPFDRAINQITTDLEALVAFFDAEIRYTRARGQDEDLGGSGNRRFVFKFKTLKKLSSRGSGAGNIVMWQCRNEVEMEMKIHGGGKLIEDRPSQLQQESATIMRTIELRTAWPAGVETCSFDATSWRAIGEDAVLKINLTVYTQETVPT